MLITQRELVKDIVREFIRIESIPISERAKDADMKMPLFISAGDGTSLFVSHKLDKAIARFAKRLMDDNSFLKPRFSVAEWCSRVRGLFGPVLVSIDLTHGLDENAASVLASVKEKALQGTDAENIREYTFGCSLFTHNEINSFRVGPVLFEARHVWLDRKYSTGAISSVSRRRILQTWNGAKIRSRKPSKDSSHEVDLVETIGSSLFVCSVKTHDIGVQSGQDKALMAARFAMTAVALVWNDTSRVLNRTSIAFDRQAHRRKVLAFASDRICFTSTSWSNLPLGISIKSHEWDLVVKEYSDEFSVVGEMLEYVVHPQTNCLRPNMMSTLFHSFLWFHEGCREALSPIAVAKLAASLDALSCGNKAGGIVKLINSRLKMDGSNQIFADGPTLQSTIARIYDQGRSRLIHGNNKELGHDWSDTKNIAEQFGRMCLLECLKWIFANPNCDDPNQLRLSNK